MFSLTNKSCLYTTGLAGLLLVSATQQASAQVFSGDYTVSGSTVTGSGTSGSAFFTGAASTGYDVTVDTGANLTNSGSQDQIQLDHGTVTVQSGTTIAGANGIDITGTGSNTSTVNNAGTIIGNNEILIDGNGIVNNSGTLGGPSSGDGGINILGNATVTNSGTVYIGFFSFGVSLGNSSAAAGTGGPISFINTASGLISGTSEVYGQAVEIFNSSNGTAANAGTIFTSGFVSARGIAFTGVTSGSILNSGSISAVGLAGAPQQYQGVSINGSNNITDTNTGTVTVSGTGLGYAEAIFGSNNIVVNNSNLINVSSTGTEAYGVYVDGTSSNIAMTNTGTIEASGGSTISSGIHTLAGSTGVAITNSGTITGTNYGVYLGGNNSSVTTTTGGVIQGGTDAIALAGTNDTVTVRGQSHIVGTIQGDVTTPGTPLSGDTLNLNLTHLTPGQIAAFNAEIAAAGTGAGSFTVGSDTYSWDSFSTVNLTASVGSISSLVDHGLGDIAGRLDNLPSLLSTDFDPFYTAAANNPEAALNSLTGREIVSAIHTMSRTDDAAFGELTDSRALDIRSGDVMASAGPVLVARLYDNNRMSDAHVDSPEIQTHWNAWLSGAVTLANQGTTYTSNGYRATSGSPTVGADIRVTNDLAIGGLFSMQSMNADFTDGSSLDLQTGLLGAYAAWSHDSWYANGLIGAGYSSYDNQRMTLGGQMASSDPSGSKILANVSGGYDFNLQGWKLSPIAGLQYTRLGIDGYTETGAGSYDLSVGDQTINSLRSKIGARLEHEVSWEGIDFTPNLRASWYHELLNGTQSIDESLEGAPELGSFGVQTTKPDRDFAMLGIGVSAHPSDANRNVTLSLDYNAQAGRDFLANTLYGHVRIEF